MARAVLTTPRQAKMGSGRQEELELHFHRFPDIPREVIVKEDVLRHGVFFSPAAGEDCNDYPLFFLGDRRRSFHLQTTGKASPEMLSHHRSMRAPESLTIRSGLYGLRPTQVHVRLSPNSPYLVDKVDGKLTLRADGAPLAEVAYPPVPKYRSKSFEDGTSYADVVFMYFGHQLHVASVTCLRQCQYFQKGLACKFCDFGNVARQMKDMGITSVLTKKVDQVAQVMETIFREETGPTTPISYCLTGGTITDDVSGLDDTAFYLQYLTAIKERIGNRWPGILMIEAKPKEDIRRFAETGPVSFMANLEVWDKHLFAEICPGKEERVGWAEWNRRLLDAVDVLGQGNVLSNLVAGVEMAQSDGFTDVPSAVKSTSEGIDYLMSHGVLPTLCNWIAEPGSALGKQDGLVPLEYFIRVDQAWYETWKKYWLPPPSVVAGPIGPGRSTYGVSAFLDVGY